MAKDQHYAGAVVDASSLERALTSPASQISWPTINPQFPRKVNGHCSIFSFVTILVGAPVVIAVLLAVGPSLLTIMWALATTVLILAIPLLAVIYVYFATFWTSFEEQKVMNPGLFVDIIPWSCSSIFVQMVYIILNVINVTQTAPTGADMTVKDLKPKAKLKTQNVPFTVNLQVPKATESEWIYQGFLKNCSTCGIQWPGAWIADMMTGHSSLMPMPRKILRFKAGEDPVAFVMNTCGIQNVYPDVYEPWSDKVSNAALVRFCRFGFAANRLESVLEGENDDASDAKPCEDGHPPKVKYFVVRTNSMAMLEVEVGYAPYGGDVYFDRDWKPVMIKDLGLAKEQASQKGLDPAKVFEPVIIKPGDRLWDYAKFRFRSTLFVLVTFADHLWDVHLVASNIGCTSCRESLDPGHPMRRFLSPFFFNTIVINQLAMGALVGPGGLLNNCMALTPRAYKILWASAEKFVIVNVRRKGGMPLHVDNPQKLYKFLKEQRGIDTPYFQRAAEFYTIMHDFLVDYVKSYYGRDYEQNFILDPEVVDFFTTTSVITSKWVAVLHPGVGTNAMGFGRKLSKAPSMPHGKQVELFDNAMSILASYCHIVTFVHRQVGGIQPYAQDASFCATRWEPWFEGHTLSSDKQTAIAAAILSSSTSTAMPFLMQPYEGTPGRTEEAGKSEFQGEGGQTQAFETNFSEQLYRWHDWTHLFPDPANVKLLQPSSTTSPGDPFTIRSQQFWDVRSKENQKAHCSVTGAEDAFWSFQKRLQAMARDCDRYDAEADQRAFPDCYPLANANPKRFETSVSF